MKRVLVAAALASMVAAPAAGADGAARVFKPAGQWTADFGEDYCRLARNFTDGTATITLGLERIQPGDSARMIIVGDELKLYRRATEAGYRYLPEGEDRTAFQLLRSETPDGKHYLNFGTVRIGPALKTFGPPPPYDREAEQAYASAMKGMVFTEGFVDPVEIDTGSLKNVVALLQTCTDDLVKYWGLDPAKHQKGYIPAIPDKGGSGWLPQGTIPFGEFGKLGGGSNMVRLMVDAAGKPTACHVHWPSLSQTLNDKICKTLLDNGHFTPAKDPQGNAMASFWVGSPMFLGPPMRGAPRPQG